MRNCLGQSVLRALNSPGASLVTSLFWMFSVSCSSPSAEVSLSTESLSQRAALTGVELDDILLRVSGSDIDTVEERVTADTDVVRLTVPAGPSRRFELFALRRIDDPDVPELPVFFGETEQDLVVGANEVGLPYQAQGAIRLSLAALGGDAVPDARVIALQNESGERVQLPLERTTVVPRGRYRLAENTVFPDPLRAASAFELNVGTGEVVDEVLSLFRPDTQCLPEAPAEVRTDGAGCTAIDFEVQGLSLDSLTVRINDVDVVLDANGEPVSGDALPGFPTDTEYEVVFVSAGDNPRQECNVVDSSGEGSDGAIAIDVICGSLLYPATFEIFGVPPDGLEVDLIDDGSVVQTVAVDREGVFGTGQTLTEEQLLESARLETRAPGGGRNAIRCNAVERVRLVDGASAPARIFCIATPAPVYPEAADLGQYLLNDGPDVLSASGAACPADVTGFDACIHAGVMRSFVIPGYSSCDDLTLVDNVRVLDWRCREQDGVVTAYSRHRLDLAGLFTFAGDPPVPVQSEFAVIIEDRSEDFAFAGPLFVGWDNPVEDGTALDTFDSPGTLYVLQGSPEETSRAVVADGVSVVVERFGTVRGRIDVDDANFVTLAGSFRASSTSGLTINGVGTSQFLSVGGRLDGGQAAVVLPAQSELRGAEVVNARSGVVMQGSYGVVADSRFAAITEAAIEVENDHQRVARVEVVNVDVAVRSIFDALGRSSNDVWLDDLRASVRSDGVVVSGAAGLRVTNSVFALDSNSAGLNVDGADVALSIGVIFIHNTVPTGFISAVDFNVGQNLYFEGIVSEGLGGYRFNDVETAVLRDQALFPIVGLPEVREPIVSARESSNVRFVGQLMHTSADGSYDACRSIDGERIGFLNATCVDAEGNLPLPSTATAQAFPIGVRAELVIDERGELVLADSSPALNLSPDPDRLTAQLITWGDFEGRCEDNIHDSVRNDARGTCETVFLEHAREVDGDGDGFCESDETCRYLPDPGGAQREVVSFETVTVDAEPPADDTPGLSGIRLQVPTAFAQHTE